MGAQNKILINTQLALVRMGSLNDFLYGKFVLFASSFWASASSLFPTLFALFIRTFFRVKINERISESNLGSPELDQMSEAQVGKEKEETEFNVAEVRSSKEEEQEGEESPKLFFKFKYQTYKEEDYDLNGPNSVSSTSTSKYEFFSRKDLSQYLNQPEVVSLSFSEFYADSKDGVIGNKKIGGDELLSDENGMEKEAGKQFVSGEKEGNAADEPEKLQVETELESDHVEAGKIDSDEMSVSGAGEIVHQEDNVLTDEDVSGQGDQFLLEKEFVGFDSDSVSIASLSHEFIIGHCDSSTSYGFLSDKDFEEALDEEELEFAGIDLRSSSTGYEAEDFDEEDSDLLEELKELERSQMKDSTNLGSEKLLEKDIRGFNSTEQEEQGHNTSEPNKTLDDNNAEKSDSQDLSGWDTEDSSDFLWEQQDFMEQHKMDMKKVRATGLPTIAEDDEYPKIMEDFKPWKIDQKFHHEDRMSELHKFYRSYKERMRKLDILNYQKRIAMGCFHSKDPLQSIPSQKDSAPAFLSLFSNKFLPCRRKISASDPMMNIITELQSEFETVYVGQMCLSWEILHWQYEKALELWDSDHYGIRRYNEVAGEFQHFQVLLQRFVENETFEGPRVENYTNKRYLLRNLLQVPVIREDSSKDKKARRPGKDDGMITTDRLIEIMEETIRIFWRFVKADKDAHNVTRKCRQRTQIEPQDPTELELLTEVQTNLEKKEKRLKDVLRCGNCILRKFQKQQEDDSDHVLYFFSQVDMKLVSRVLNMSKITTDQLLWCRNTLSKINFVSGRIHVEPSFSLFPC